jgi:hypothetical protein
MISGFSKHPPASIQGILNIQMFHGEAQGEILVQMSMIKAGIWMRKVAMFINRGLL